MHQVCTTGNNMTLKIISVNVWHLTCEVGMLELLLTLHASVTCHKVSRSSGSHTSQSTLIVDQYISPL